MPTSRSSTIAPLLLVAAPVVVRAQQRATLNRYGNPATRSTNYHKDLVVAVGNGPRPRMNGSQPARPPRPAVP